jgi:Xaa-Pro aminopeptidase
MVDMGFNRVPFDWENRKEWLDIPFPLEEYEQRVTKTQQAMKEADLQSLLIHGAPGWLAGEVRYISNFPSEIGNTIVVIPVEGELMLTTDSIFHSAPMHSKIFMTWIKDVRPAHLLGTVRKPELISRHVKDFLMEKGLDDKKTGVVGERFFPGYLLNDLKQELPKLQFSSATDLYLRVKSIKSKREIDLMEEGCRITARGLEAAMDLAAPGVSELEMSAAAHNAMALGAETITFMAMVGGPRAGHKTVSPSARKLEDGDMIFMDMGVNYKGYNTDCCRTMVAGKVGKKQKEILEVGLEMENAVIAAGKPGVRICDLQKLAQDIADKSGYGDHYWPTGFGHGIGTDIAEIPRLFLGNEEPLQAGQTFALEPMIVIQGLGVGCFEDIIVVEENGCRELGPAKKQTW